MKTKKKDGQSKKAESRSATAAPRGKSADEKSMNDSAPTDPQVEIEALKDALHRAKADFANLQRRAAVERAEAVRFANADLLKTLLGVLDDFDRTIGAADSSDNLKSVVDGVHLVHANFVKALQDNGLEEINALHETFDPTIHEALLQQPTTSHVPGTVVEQVSKGYRLRDRVLRPAKVIVAKAADEKEQNDSEKDSPDAETVDP